jgi:hypothetical protein
MSHRILMKIIPVVCAVAICLTAPSRAQAAEDALLLRLFLTDGTSLVSFGEFARVDDRVIFSMAVGGSVDEPRLQAVTVPAGSVDWPRTERHAASARYQRYAQTRGEEDFLRLSNDVAAVLNEVLLTSNRARALEIAQAARAQLISWPREHFGYRQRDIQEIVAVLDQAISDLRPVATPASFEVALVGFTPEVALEPLAALPSPREQIDQIFRVVALTERASERVALLRVALVLLGEAPASIPATEITTVRRAAEAEIRRETTIDARYDALVRRLMSQATKAAERASPASVEQVLSQITREDTRLGRRRPEVVQALHASIQSRLHAARQLRLLRDQWTLRRSLYRDYERDVGSQMLRLVRSQPLLEAIRSLDGPAPDELLALQERLGGGLERLSKVRAPSDLQATHDLLMTAWRFAENAVQARYNAIRSADVNRAWEASSAAAGALLLLSRVQDDLRALLEPPRLPLPERLDAVP